MSKVPGRAVKRVPFTTVHLPFIGNENTILLFPSIVVLFDDNKNNNEAYW